MGRLVRTLISIQEKILKNVPMNVATMSRETRRDFLLKIKGKEKSRFLSLFLSEIFFEV